MLVSIGRCGRLRYRSQPTVGRGLQAAASNTITLDAVASFSALCSFWLLLLLRLMRRESPWRRVSKLLVRGFQRGRTEFSRISGRTGKEMASN